MNNAMIEFRHVSKSFSRKGHPVLALQDINLSIERGDIFGIIGYSGAGKSTLLRLINRLETPGEGEVLLNGEPLQACSGQRLQAIKKDIGMIFQNFNLLNSKTVFHNIAIPLILQGRDKAFIQARVAELLAFVDLSDKIHSYPNELSGGQKQRVGIARRWPPTRRSFYAMKPPRRSTPTLRCRSYCFCRRLIVGMASPSY